MLSATIEKKIPPEYSPQSPGEKGDGTRLTVFPSLLIYRTIPQLSVKKWRLFSPQKEIWPLFSNLIKKRCKVLQWWRWPFHSCQCHYSFDSHLLLQFYTQTDMHAHTHTHTHTLTLTWNWSVISFFISFRICDKYLILEYQAVANISLFPSFMLLKCTWQKLNKDGTFNIWFRFTETDGIDQHNISWNGDFFYKFYTLTV